MQPTDISDVRTIGINVADQDDAMAFYADAEARHAAMRERGVHVGEVRRWEALPRDRYPRCEPVTRANAPRTAA